MLELSFAVRPASLVANVTQGGYINSKHIIKIVKIIA